MASLQEYADEAAAALGVAGAQVALFDGSGIEEVAVGMANLDTGVPVTPETLFSVGSTTKLYTAALVMQLVDEGQVDLDHPLEDHLPGVALSGTRCSQDITPRQLMSMSSGLDNGPYVDHGRGDDAVRRYVDGLRTLPELFAPGAGYGYSNASTIVSGLLVERATGLDWDSALRTRLLEPAGLHSSFTLVDDIIHRRFSVGHALGPDRTPDVIHAWPMPRAMGPAGATMFATAGDLVRFGQLFLRDGRGAEGQPVLSPAAVTEMQRPQVACPPTLLADHWGLGPYVKAWDGIQILGHSGTTPCGSSYLMWAPELNVAIATTVNTPELGYPFAHSVFRHVFPERFGVGLPDTPEPDDGLAIDTARFVGRYEMAGEKITVERDAGGLTARTCGPSAIQQLATPTRLRPLTATTFLPTHPALDGNRGWALAFVGPEDRPATHLVKGFFALRRVA